MYNDVRLLGLLATGVATFSVKHFLLEQEPTMKQFIAQMQQENLMADEKCALVHKCLQYLRQKLLRRSNWGSNCKLGVVAWRFKAPVVYSK